MVTDEFVENVTESSGHNSTMAFRTIVRTGARRSWRTILRTIFHNHLSKSI